MSEDKHPLTSKQKAEDILRHLEGSERESLLIKCWMSHDARWFLAVAQEHGMAVANRLNQIAAHELGKVEATRIARALRLPPAENPDDYLLVQEVLIGLLGPDLIEYQVEKVGEDGLQMHVSRCFAHENVIRAGIDEQYECGILARLTGWISAQELDYEIDPRPGRCLKTLGQECIYSIALKRKTPEGASPG